MKVPPRKGGGNKKARMYFTDYTIQINAGTGIILASAGMLLTDIYV